MATLDELIARYDWRYFPRGRVTHALDPLGGVVAWCGRMPQSADQWHGTGSQSEHEKADALPRCADCLQALSDIAASDAIVARFFAERQAPG